MRTGASIQFCGAKSLSDRSNRSLSDFIIPQYSSQKEIVSKGTC